MSRELQILKERIRGPIQKIEDPSNHTIDEILASYFRMILFLARKFSRPTVEYEDLVVEGLIGLLDAVKRFDPEKAGDNKKAFHNLAVVRIKSNMFEFFLSNNNLYSVPNYMARAITLVQQARNLINSQDHEGDSEEILLNYEIPNIEDCLPKDVAVRVAELKDRIKALAGNTTRTYEEMVTYVLGVERNIQGYEEQESMEVSPEQEASQRDFLEKFLVNLNPDAREVMRLLLEGNTLDDTGRQMGFSRQRAQQIREDTLKFFSSTRMFKESTEE